jgi:hypothetical protein
MERMRALGWVDGRTVTVEYGWSGERPRRQRTRRRAAEKRDRKLELGRLQHGKLSRISTLEDAIHVRGRTPK